MGWRRALFFAFIFTATFAAAQDTLPKFSAILKSNGKVIISWHNTFQSVSQISIQRSQDSLKNFTSFMTVPDPSISQNGFVDPKAEPGTFYRLFVVLQNGNYFFSKSRHASSESSPVAQENDSESKDPRLRNDEQRVVFQRSGQTSQMPSIRMNQHPPVEIEMTIYIKRNDTLIGQLPGKTLNRFRDSILKKTKDTLTLVGPDTVVIRPYVPKEVYKISNYVFTGRDGNVNISLPDVAGRKYSIKFLELDSSPVFDIKEIKDALLIVDKTNFLHSGWFRFELYEDGKLKEKNRLFIPKEF
ncbi:MAG TPA: hypothetical protein VKR32_06625 [Puia sp.]|nr:hypothetical protein [Puia sp.]